MARYHVSEDGNPRICTAQSPESCGARGMDGDAAPHGDFADSKEARRFAEDVLEKAIGSDGLSSTSRDNRNLGGREGQSVAVPDRKAFSQDLGPNYEARVEGGRLKVKGGGDDQDFGELTEISKEEFDAWSEDYYGEAVSLEDGEVAIIEDEIVDGAYARFGEKFYRVGSGGLV